MYSIMVFIHLSALGSHDNAGELHPAAKIKPVGGNVVVRVRLKRDILKMGEIRLVLEFIHQDRAESPALIFGVDTQRKYLHIVFVADRLLGHIDRSEQLLDDRRSAQNSKEGVPREGYEVSAQHKTVRTAGIP